MTETIWVVSSIEELKGVAGELLGLWKQMDVAREAAVVVALSGDLGAGKTTFIQQLAQILGVVESVTSPTFVIMKSYETIDSAFESLVHMDAYRIEDDSELAPLNFSEVLTQSKTLVCIEWAERISASLPAHTIKMDLESLPHGKHQLTYYAD
jgi:tRNA threonylcarbamoyladenosine biosynthesis protein TsaE